MRWTWETKSQMNAKANIDIVLITASSFIFPINMISHLLRRAWSCLTERTANCKATHVKKRPYWQPNKLFKSGHGPIYSLLSAHQRLVALKSENLWLFNYYIRVERFVVSFMARNRHRKNIINYSLFWFKLIRCKKLFNRWKIYENNVISVEAGKKGIFSINTS